jgi:hypothetical protein
MAMLWKLFEAMKTRPSAVEMGLVLPAYDYCLKCSHTFNLLGGARSYQRDPAHRLHRPHPQSGPGARPRPMWPSGPKWASPH